MTTNKILPVALVAALLGGTVGALVMRPSSKAPEVAQATRSNLAAQPQAQVAGVTEAKAGDELLEKELATETKSLSEQERAAFRDGFIEGARAAREAELAAPAAATVTRSAAPSRVVYRDAPRARRVASREAPRRVYYDYGERRGRSFWQKHRDKLTVAMGAGGGALVGGLVGGKKGALIGGLAGAGGSALYTYKLRKRDRRY